MPRRGVFELEGNGDGRTQQGRPAEAVKLMADPMERVELAVRLREGAPRRTGRLSVSRSVTRWSSMRSAWLVMLTRMRMVRRMAATVFWMCRRRESRDEMGSSSVERVGEGT